MSYSEIIYVNLGHISSDNENNEFANFYILESILSMAISRVSVTFIIARLLYRDVQKISSIGCAFMPL